MADPTQVIDWAGLSMGLLGGLALFLYGMDRMGDALRGVAGGRMKSILAALSDNRFIGLFTGASVTAIIQSSSVTTVMLVGFVSADLMTLSQSIGVILGADIGTTITAQIVAFKVTKYALLLVAAGFAVLFTAKNETNRQYGYMVMGLGLIFFGMSVMSEAMYPLRTYQPFMDVMARMDNPLYGILAATLFTGLIQSSSAAMGVVIVLAMQGLITLEAGIALALGANIGTCATAGLAAIGKPREAVRVAVAHVLFKIVGVALIFPFIPYFSELVREISPAGAAGASGQELLASVVPRQVANAHTLFNVGIALVFLPFTGPFARLITWMVPDLEEEEGEEASVIRAKHLDELLLKTPGLALDASRRELVRLAKYTGQMVDEALQVVVSSTPEEIESVRDADDKVDVLYGRIVTFLGKISRQSLDRAQTRELMDLMSIANDLESIGDIIETDIVALGRRRLESDVTVSPQTQEVLGQLHELVRKTFRLASQALRKNDHEIAQRVIKLKVEIQEAVVAAERHQAKRLVADQPDRLITYAIEIDLVDKLRRIYYHSKRIAKALIVDQTDDHGM